MTVVFCKSIGRSQYISNCLYLQVERSSLCLQEDFNRVARFPNSSGSFETTVWRDRTSLEVMGTDIGANNAPNVQLPSPQQFGIIGMPGSRTSSTNVTPAADQSSRNHLSTPNAFSFQKPKAPGELRRKVFYAEFDADSLNPVPMGTAYLKLMPEQCKVTEVAQLCKEYLNMEDDLVIIDANGFEILDNPSTQGKNQKFSPLKEHFAYVIIVELHGKFGRAI